MLSERSAAVATAIGLLCVMAPAVTAQEPVASRPTETVTGVVVDAESGGGIDGASVTLSGTGRRVVADSSGAFALPDLPLGPALLRVEGFGYAELLLPLTVAVGMEPLRVRLQPDPIALEGIDVRGRRGRAALSGVVLDALSGEGIPFAALWLRDERRFASDERGAFRLPSVPPGSYLLLAQRMGYEGLYVHVNVRAEMEPVVVRLRPDPVVLEGITVVSQRFRGRRNAYPRIVRAFDENRLRRTGLPDLFSFLQYEAFLGFSICDGNRNGLCVLRRGYKLQPRVYVDEQYLICGLDMLNAYHPSQFYLVEVYGGGLQIRAYTHEYVERQARRPRMIEPADLPPPGLPAC
jgi:hypothetical protein